MVIWFIYIYILFVPCIMSVLVLLLCPYKVDWCNALDAFFWLILVISNIWFLYYEAFDNVYNFISHVLKCIPLLYFFCYSLCNLFTRIKICCTAPAKRDSQLEKCDDDASIYIH